MANTDPVSKTPIRTLATTDVQAQLADSTGNLVTSQGSGAQRALDVGINVAGVQIDPRQIRALTSADIVTAAQGAPALAANAWPIKISDGTSIAAVKAASTAAATTDPSLVVALSPNSPTPAGANIIGKVEVTDGTNVQAVKAASTAAVATDPSAVVALSPNSPLPAGQTGVIGAVRLDDGAGNAVTSTTINAKQRLDVNSASDGVTGSAVPFQTTQVGGSDGTNLRALNTDTGGRLNSNVFVNGSTNSATNPVFVSVGNTTPGTPVNYYNATSSTVAAGGTDSTSVYTITTSKTLSLKKAFVSASVHMRCDLQISANGTTWTTIASIFIPYGGGNGTFDYDEISVQESGTGSGVRVVFNNEDTSPATGYVSLLGVEN